MWAKSQDSVHKPQFLKRRERRAEADRTKVSVSGLVVSQNIWRRQKSHEPRKMEGERGEREEERERGRNREGGGREREGEREWTPKPALVNTTVQLLILIKGN